jgi:hypothetical protein
VGPLTVPYVSPAEFTAAPTFLDLTDIRVGDNVLADQTAELTNLLLRSSTWAEGICSQPLHAHVLTEQRRLHADRWGRVKFTPKHGPIRGAANVTAFGYGNIINALTFLTPITGVWVDGSDHGPQNAVVVQLGAPQVGPWTGSLQFGGPLPNGELYTEWTVTAGYPNTLFAAPATKAATQITVLDATGLMVGDSPRICDPGLEEAVTVTGIAANVLTLAAPLANAHATSVGVSMLPHDVKQAIINYTAALLLRPDQASEDPFPDTGVQPTSGAADSSRRDGSGLVSEACRLLNRYARTY